MKFYNWMKRQAKAVCVGVGGLFTSSLVFAATSTPLDTTNAVAQIGEINTAVAAVGAALVAAAAIAVGFKWLKAAIFG